MLKIYKTTFLSSLALLILLPAAVKAETNCVWRILRANTWAESGSSSGGYSGGCQAGETAALESKCPAAEKPSTIYGSNEFPRCCCPTAAAETVETLSPSKFITPELQIPIPNLELAEPTCTGSGCEIPWLAQYFLAIYDYGLSIVGILAALVLMAGGILWLTSAGNESRITQAKELIAGSIVGTVILFCSWIILNTINPDLLNMRNINLYQQSKQNFSTPTLIEDLSKLPSDTKYGWICMNSADQTCAENDPPSVNLSHNICRNGGSSYNARLDNCPYALLWCCGQSATMTQMADNACQGKPDSTPCQPTITSTPTSGYCFDGKCHNEKVCCDCWKGELNIGINNCKNDITVTECLSDCTVPLGILVAKPVYHPGGSEKYTCEGAGHYCQAKP